MCSFFLLKFTFFFFFTSKAGLNSFFYLFSFFFSLARLALFIYFLICIDFVTWLFTFISSCFMLFVFILLNLDSSYQLCGLQISSLRLFILFRACFVSCFQIGIFLYVPKCLLARFWQWFSLSLVVVTLKMISSNVKRAHCPLSCLGNLLVSLL